MAKLKIRSVSCSCGQFQAEGEAVEALNAHRKVCELGLTGTSRITFQPPPREISHPAGGITDHVTPW